MTFFFYKSFKGYQKELETIISKQEKLLEIWKEARKESNPSKTLKKSLFITQS